MISNAKLAAWVILAATVLFALAVTKSFGSTTDVPRPNSLGVRESYQNPNTYLLALPVDGQILDGRFTNIRFQPYAAAMFDTSILFCGDVTEEFAGKSGPLTVTYSTRASGMYRGIGCHNLVSVFTVNGR